jgi:hypothetical protein
MSQATTGGHGLPAERLALGGRTMSQGMFGGIALVLGIVGLAVLGNRPDPAMYLDAIAQLALGVALIVFGVALATAYARLIAGTEVANGIEGTATGTTGDMFLGAAVVILGVLALLRIATDVLIPVQVILVGLGLLLNSVSSVRVSTLEAPALSGSDMAGRVVARRVNEELVWATAGVRVLAGVAVGILGIIALANGNAAVLTLSAAIVAGAAMLLASTTLSSRLIVSLSARTA